MLVFKCTTIFIKSLINIFMNNDLKNVSYIDQDVIFDCGSIRLESRLSKFRKSQI